MQKPSEHFFSYTIKATENDIDALGHVNNIVYLRWIQEASSAHWFSVVRDEAKQNYIWVILRHEIDYLYPALLHDDIVAYTWVGEHIGARSERFVQICNAATGKIFAESKTIWCLLTAKDMRPVRIDRGMRRILGK